MQEATKGVAGHEGAGVVVAVGSDMKDKWKVGDRAGIKWIWSTCGHCDMCTLGVDYEVHCPNQVDTAVHVPGTFQQYAVADGRYTTRIPDGVSDEGESFQSLGPRIYSMRRDCSGGTEADRPFLRPEAAPIMCGGVTAYCGVKKCDVRAGQFVALFGYALLIGG
jgi:alcohol dehydrogenase, propanol-preferring